jgi:hypothetical protein
MDVCASPDLDSGVTLLRVPSPPGTRPLLLSARVARILDELDRGSSLDAFARFEDRLASALELDDVLGVWIDWARGRTWCPRGVVSARLEELVPAAAGSGRRVVLHNAIVEPIGRVPSRMVLVLKGPPERLFRQHTLRTIKRVGARLAPTIERLGR